MILIIQMAVSYTHLDVYKRQDADDALHLYDVFMDGANYLGNVSSFSNKKEAETKIDYATLITYQNWTKE